MRNVLTIIIFLLAFAAHLASQNVADIVKQSCDAVVLIVISDSSGQETALGSGFLISADGQIVTNYHVIKDAHSAIVKLSNGSFFPVSGVVASDAKKDLAIIKVNGKNLPFLPLTNVDKVQVGSHVVAIGSPLGLEGTVSDGVVSAIRDSDGVKWIQTTAPVSHGNSGGPLLDMGNHVVGVITMGINPGAGQNLNFAIPSDEVANLLVGASQPPKSLGTASEKNGDTFSSGTIWTSLTNGHDYNLKQDSDYLYIDWVNIPPELKTSGAFIRSELKKSSNGKWQGETHSRMPCTYTQGGGVFARVFTNWCSHDLGIEIDLLSDKRIEGLSNLPEKFDCRKCQAEGRVEQKPFTWIPK